MAEMLIEHGAQINVSEKHCITPLHLAIANQNPEQVTLLIKHHAPLSNTTDAGDTPLVLAVLKQQPNIVKILLSHGASPDQADRKGLT
jgi:ankyrin repeat protein